VSRHVVAKLSDIPPGARRIVEVEGRSIGVFNVHGELYAIRNRCPHQGAPLCAGVVDERIESSCPGEYRRTGEALIRCPWHGWEFELGSGRSWFDPAHTRVRTYALSVQRAGERSPGPYTAERYRLTVEEATIVLHLPDG
jgi:nitrite reductase/ring-hydroxylating ferredoxin subunit